MKLIVALFMVACAMTVLTCGTGSEVEGKQCLIEGRAIDTSGSPVANALVRIRPNGFLALDESAPAGLDTVTDADGYFYFDKFDTTSVDSYTIEINKNGKYGALQNLGIGVSENFHVVLPAATLTPTGTIIGRINLPISDDTSRPWVALYNVDYSVAMPLMQDFSFTGIPAGVYSLQIIPFRGSRLSVALHDIIVMSDSVVDVGTLNFNLQPFFRGCTSFECDSIAVRSILDVNGLPDVTVASVVKTDAVTGRVITLDLSGRSISVVTKEIGGLSELSTLELRNNTIGSLPAQIGYLRNLERCHIDGNRIQSLPAEIRYLNRLSHLTAGGNELASVDGCVFSLPLVELDLSGNRLKYLPDAGSQFSGIRYLYLQDNELTSVPVSFEKLSPQVLLVDGNRLCNILQIMAAWLNRYDADWWNSQQCQ